LGRGTARGWWSPLAPRREASIIGTFVRIKAQYRRHFRDHRRERMFLASVCFLLTFALARALTHLGRANSSQFAIVIGDTHVHHLVWGILLLLLVGYLWLIQVGTGLGGSSARSGRLVSLIYGAGAALTLDEFALWLHLEDVYWEQRGRASIDAVMMFGAFVSAGLWGGPFLRAIARTLARAVRRRATAAMAPAGDTDQVNAMGPPVEPQEQSVSTAG
jgi:hypothetical protein